MPKLPTKNQNGQTKAQAKAAAISKPPQELEVIYPTITVNGVEIPDDKVTITADWMKQALGWEDDDGYAVRTGETPGSVKISEDKILLTDEYGKRVWCMHNAKNRPFTESWSRQIAQSILTGNYEFNLETIVISRTGQMTSGQHRGIGLILAKQMWEKDPEKYPYWKTEPTIRSLVAFGGSDEQKVLNTIDNTRKQEPSDAFYRSEIFADKTNVEKRELARMLDTAIDTLWVRTGYGINRFQTVSESVLFEERHPDVKLAVAHLFEENKSRAISLLKLSPGACAALMYLMAASEVDGEAYRKSDQPSLKRAKLTQWEKARNFFSELAKKNGPLAPVRAAIADVIQNGTGKAIERLTVLVKAWPYYLAGKKITDKATLMPNYRTSTDKGREFDDWEIVIEGIDLGPKPEDDDEDNGGPSEAERKKAEAAERKARNVELNERAKAANAERAVTNSILEDVKKQRASLKIKEGSVLLAKAKSTDNYYAWDVDADTCVKVLGSKAESVQGVNRVVILGKDVEAAIAKLTKAKHHVSVASEKQVGPGRGDVTHDVKEHAAVANKPVTRK